MKRAKPEFNHSNLYKKEDWWACWIGFIVLALCVAGVIGVMYKAPKVGSWSGNPFDAFTAQSLSNFIIMFVGLVVVYLVALKIMGVKVKTFIPAFFVVFLIAIIAMWIGSQKSLKGLGLSYPL